MDGSGAVHSGALSVPLGFAYRRYRRRFRQPLNTAHGCLTWREGIVLRLEAEDRVGYGEIAPLPWFGSETLAAAEQLCQHLGSSVQPQDLLAIPDAYPACQFGFGSALEQLKRTEPLPLRCLAVAGLLPAGLLALERLPQLYRQGFRTFKWKIGVSPLEAEISLFHQLCQHLPPDARLRLDANGGLTVPEAEVWLQLGEANHLTPLEYLEQPLSPAHWPELLELSQRYRTPLALDESVAQVGQVEAIHRSGWRGIYILKPAIAGYPQRLRRYCLQHRLDAVFSSVFETGIGRQAVLQLATDCGNWARAMGLGVQDWLEDDGLDHPDPEQVWQRLCNNSSSAATPPG